MFNILAEIELFNLGSLISFLVGIFAGFVIMLSIFAILASREKKVADKNEKASIINLDEERIKELIKTKQDAFTMAIEEEDKGYIKTTTSLSLELLHEISSYYYPDSKYPEYELTIVEATELIEYIIKQISEMFEKPVLSRFKTMKISSIANLIEKTKNSANSKAVKAVSDSGASEVASTAKNILNTLNPVYWIKKIVINGTINITIKKVCRAGIAIVGKESNNVYSGNLFKKDDSTELVDEELSSIEEE